MSAGSRRTGHGDDQQTQSENNGKLRAASHGFLTVKRDRRALTPRQYCIRLTASRLAMIFYAAPLNWRGIQHGETLRPGGSCHLGELGRRSSLCTEQHCCRSTALTASQQTHFERIELDNSRPQHGPAQHEPALMKRRNTALRKGNTTAQRSRQKRSTQSHGSAFGGAAVILRGQ